MERDGSGQEVVTPRRTVLGVKALGKLKKARKERYLQKNNLYIYLLARSGRYSKGVLPSLKNPANKRVIKNPQPMAVD